MTLPGQNADVVAAATPGGAGGFRGRVEQQVDAITGSANRVLSGVVDSSFGVLRSILPIAGVSDGSAALASADGGEDGLAASAPWNITRPGFGLLRRESGFSIASLAASLPGASGMRDRARSFASAHSGVGGGGGAEEEGQEMVESRPGSVKGVSLREESEESGEGEEEESEEEGDEEGSEEEEDPAEARHDVRSIRSFESMMSSRSRSSRHQHSVPQIQTQSLKADGVSKKERMSITDRLASMSRFTKGASTSSASAHSQEPSAQSIHHVRLFLLLRYISTRLTRFFCVQISPVRSSSLNIGSYGRDSTRFDTPISSRASSPVASLRPLSGAVPLPSRRFLECNPDDLRMSEVPELLAEYRRLVESMRLLGAFEEQS